MRRGATLIEIVIVIAILGVLVAVAIFRAGRLVDRIEVRSAAADVEWTLAAARQLAITRGTSTTVTIDQTSAALLVLIGGDTLFVRQLGRSHGVALSATRTAVAYTPVGLGFGLSNSSIIVRRADAADTVFVSRLGRVRH